MGHANATRCVKTVRGLGKAFERRIEKGAAASAPPSPLLGAARRALAKFDKQSKVKGGLNTKEATALRAFLGTLRDLFAALCTAGVVGVFDAVCHILTVVPPKAPDPPAASAASKSPLRASTHVKPTKSSGFTSAKALLELSASEPGPSEWGGNGSSSSASSGPAAPKPKKNQSTDEDDIKLLWKLRNIITEGAQPPLDSSRSRAAESTELVARGGSVEISSLITLIDAISMMDFTEEPASKGGTGRVVVSTIHQAKGPCCVVLGCVVLRCAELRYVMLCRVHARREQGRVNVKWAGAE